MPDGHGRLGTNPCLTFTTSNRPSGYTYDAAGNLITEPLSPPNNYTYDNENRMTGFSGSGGTAAYTYDDNNDRVQKSLSGGATTVYVFSGGKVIAEYDNGALPSSPSREYIYSEGGPNSGLGPQLVAKIEAGATQYYHQDRLSARLMTDSSGNILGQQGHFPFGETWYQSGTTTKWEFTSYERDQDSGNNSGLDYAMARFYDSRVASFCSADPVEGRSDDPQSWNRYAYVANDPINATDPGGQFLELLFALLEPLLQAAADVGIPTISVTSTYFVITPAVLGTVAAGEAAVGGAVLLSEKDQSSLQKDKDKATNQQGKGLNNQKCRSFLQQHGIDPDKVKDAVNQEVGYNGLQSKISIYNAHTFDPQDPGNVLPNGELRPEVVTEFQKETIIDSFKNLPYGSQQDATSEIGGHSVYFRPSGFGSWGSGGISVVSVLHEALHQFTSKGDTRLAEQLGLGKNGTSQDITNTLKANDCK